MPGRHPSPGIMWAGAVDASGIYNTDGWQRGGGAAVQLVDMWFDDIIELLNGRGSDSSRCLIEQVASIPGFGAFIDATDRLVLHGPDGVAFSLDPLPGNAVWGFDPAGQASVAGTVDGVPAQVLRAAREWQRVNPVVEPIIRLRVDAATWTMPFGETYAQDVMTLLRARGAGDADDPSTSSIEALDNAAYDAVNQRIRWGLDSVGHVWCAYPSFLAPITWLNVALQRVLGFRDADTPTAVPDTTLMLYRASDPPASALVPTRPAGRKRVGFDELTYGGDVTDGDATRNVVFRHHTREVTWHLDGPDDTRSLASHYAHRHRATWQHQVTLYQQWPGEIRRALPDGVRMATGLDAYGPVYTVEEDGGRGRLICTLASRSASRESPGYAGAHRRKGELIHTLNVRRVMWP